MGVCCALLVQARCRAPGSGTHWSRHGCKAVPPPSIASGLQPGRRLTNGRSARALPWHRHAHVLALGIGGQCKQAGLTQLLPCCAAPAAQSAGACTPTDPQWPPLATAGWPAQRGSGAGQDGVHLRLVAGRGGGATEQRCLPRSSKAAPGGWPVRQAAAREQRSWWRCGGRAAALVERCGRRAAANVSRFSGETAQGMHTKLTSSSSMACRAASFATPSSCLHAGAGGRVHSSGDGRIGVEEVHSAASGGADVKAHAGRDTGMRGYGACNAKQCLVVQEVQEHKWRGPSAAARPGSPLTRAPLYMLQNWACLLRTARPPPLSAP